MDIERVKEGVKLRIACDNFINEKRPKIKILKNLSIILSIGAIVVCIGYGIYGKFFVKDESIIIWVIIGLSNFSLLCSNLYSFNHGRVK